MVNGPPLTVLDLSNQLNIQMSCLLGRRSGNAVTIDGQHCSSNVTMLQCYMVGGWCLVCDGT